MRSLTSTPRSRAFRLSGAVAASILLMHIIAAPLSAQSRADSTAIMVLLSSHLLEVSDTGAIAVRSGFDSHLMPAAARITPVRGLEGAAAKSMISVLLNGGRDRITIVPVPRGQQNLLTSQRTESAYPTAFALGGLSIEPDSAILLLKRTFNHSPRPSTFTTGEYRLRFLRDATGGWRVVSNDLLTISDGYYQFAPLENLPSAVRAEEQRRRDGPPPR